MDLNFYPLLALLVSLILLPPHGKIILQADEKARIAAEIDHSIRTELLNKWYPQSMDIQFGGFLSTFTYDWKPTGDQEKMIVTQARHTWSNARAAQVYPGISYFNKGAASGFAFLKEQMWDKKNGGFYTLVDRHGNVKQGGISKDAYGNAFAIYALSTYYQASGNNEALQLAKNAFMWLEKHSHDPVYKGYYQHLTREGDPIKRDDTTPSVSDLGYKDQNSSIHLLEALTELYSVWPDTLVRLRLQEMLVLIRDTITSKKGYLVLFFQPDWSPVSFSEATQEVILKHRNLDHVSFGHDVETAYLLIEASHVLGLKHDSITLRVAKNMFDHALQYGWDTSVGGFYDEGYYFTGKSKLTIIKDTKNWWAQAEGLNTLLLMADLFPNDSLKYFNKFLTQWKYIQQFMIDHIHGDWYQGGLDKEPEQKTALKGHIWKGNYHQLRSLINCVQRLLPDTIAPAVPKNIELTGAKKDERVKWDAVSDNKNLLGYNIYIDELRVGFTPLTSFSILGLKRSKGRRITVKSVDLSGNESGAGKPTIF
ncbi:MAG: AGE family epimerase/isomerase [Chitinophagaceae bacterium]